MLILKKANHSDANIIQEIFFHCPFYFEKVDGVAVCDSDAGEKMLEDLPPGKKSSDKFVGIFYLKERAIGVMDLARGYPDEQIAFLGLLLIREDYQKQNLGREAVLLCEKKVRDWKLKILRIAVVSNNPVEIFWKKMGFQLIGVTRPYQGKMLLSEVRVMEKLLS